MGFPKKGRLIEQRWLILERESAGLICGGFGKWENNEGEREFWELGGCSVD